MMPSAAPHDEDDPVVASYDVYITNPLPQSSATSSEHDSRLFVLQYPSHRPLSKPYNAARLQKPTRLRLKPRTGMVELDVPMLTHEHFNVHAGERYGQALAESRISQTGGSHGLAGGFASGPISAQNMNLDDVPVHGEQTNNLMATQTLGGKILIPGERDPIYMLGSFRNQELHLTHLDAVVQMRPQLHHVDAEEEIGQKRYQSQIAPSGKLKVGLEAATKMESKAIELKMKDSKEDPKDRNLNANARLLRDIQADRWRSHEWIDEDDPVAWNQATTQITLKADLVNVDKPKQLKSLLTNDEWLDRMSVPREDGKKGLRAKLKGRDRERARRKKVEHQRRQLSAENVNSTTRAGGTSDSELSSATGQSDAEIADHVAPTDEADVKEEALNPEIVEPSEQLTSHTPATGTTSKKRGRPRKIRADVVAADE